MQKIIESSNKVIKYYDNCSIWVVMKDRRGITPRKATDDELLEFICEIMLGEKILFK